MARLNKLSDQDYWNLFYQTAPTSVTGSAGNSRVTLSWTAPGATYAPPTRDYIVQYSSDSGSTWTTFTDGVATGTTATVTGLTNGTAYVFRVAATNGLGQGAWSATSDGLTPGTDSYFSNVSLLLHMDGSGSTFVDSSSYGRTITASGATQSASQKKFGAGSGVFSLSGGTDYLTLNHSSQYSFQAGDAFTIELWYYPTSFGTFNHLISKGLGSSNREWALGCTASSLMWYRFTNGDVLYSAPASVALNQWTHLAAACDGSTVTLYKDGVNVGSTGWNTPSGFGQPLWIGQFLNYQNISHETRGYIDELRITKGFARYSGSTITVPTAAFPDG